MKINRGNRDAVQDVQNAQDVNTKDVNVNAVEALAQEPKVEEAKVKEETKEEVPTGVKKVDTIVKIQEARKALAEKKAIEEKIQRQDEEAAEIQALLDDMKTGAVKSETVVKKIRSTMPKTKKAKRVGSAPGGHKLPVEEEEKVTAAPVDIESQASKAFRKEVEKIRREMAVEDIAKGLTAAMRHNKKKSIAALYEVLPDDVEIETEFGFNIMVTPEISYNEVMSCIQWIFHFAADGREFVSEPVMNISIDMGIVKAYTDLEVIDERILDQYDILKRSGYLEKIKEVISEEQIDWIEDAVRYTADNYINYQNSARGMLMALSDLANDENNGFNKMLKNFSDNTELLKQIEPIVKAYEGLQGEKTQSK